MGNTNKRSYQMNKMVTQLHDNESANTPQPVGLLGLNGDFEKSADLKNYGLTEAEITKLKLFYEKYAGDDGVIDSKEYVELYSTLNPGSIGPYLSHQANRSFKAADTNHDGFLSFEEFLVSYIMSKTNPKNFRINSINLLNQYCLIPGYLSQSETEFFANWANNFYGNESKTIDINEITSQFKGQDNVPVEDFVEKIAVII